MSQQDLNGRVALVTGASLGIGRATAISLGQAGAKVGVNYRTHAAEAQQVVRRIQADGAAAIALQGDVADQASVEQLVDRLVDHFGSLHIAVANAASSVREPFYEADMEGFRRTLDVTMWGAFYLLRAAARQMIRQNEGGAMVLISSPHAFIPMPQSMAYNMAKAALEQMAKTAALELARFRIRVNLLQPGWTDTPGERQFASEDELRQAGAAIPLGRLGTPEEIARGVLYLCDPRQDYVTGSTLLIDGGFCLPWWAERGADEQP